MSQTAPPSSDSLTVLHTILPHIHRTAHDPRPIVLMTCGISGSGKSTLAHNLVRHDPSFVRLSVDAHIYAMHGLYDVDYPQDRYTAYQEEAAEHVKAELRRLLAARDDRNVVLDLSFWNRPYRDEYRDLIREEGGRAVLVYLHAASKTALWERVQRRKENRDALELDDDKRNGDSAFDLSKDLFDLYWDGFEAPSGEGEIVIPVL